MHPPPADRNSRALTARQHRAVAALLTTRSIRVAARAIGVGERAMRRWLAEPAFRGAYAAASRDTLGHVVAQLRAASTEALDTLREALGAENEGVRVRATTALLHLAVRCDDLAERALISSDGKGGEPVCIVVQYVSKPMLDTRGWRSVPEAPAPPASVPGPRAAGG